MPSTKTGRSWVAVAAWQRRPAKDMGNKKAKGRTRADQRTRGKIKRDLND